MTEFKLKKTSLNTTTEKHSDPREIENEVTKTVSFLKGVFLRASFSGTGFVQNREPPGDRLYLPGCSFLLCLGGQPRGGIKGLWETEGVLKTSGSQEERFFKRVLTCSLCQRPGVSFPRATR